MTADFVIGFDGTDHVIIRNGQVVYEDERIIHVGKDFAGTVDRTLDYGRAVISPGFIDLNALADVDHALIDSWQDPVLSLGLQWSDSYFRSGRRDVFGPDGVRFRRRYALTQLIRNGVTTAMPIASEIHNEWAETLDDARYLARTATELGLRMYVGPAYRAGVNVVRADGGRDVLFEHELGERGLREAVAFADEIASSGGDLVRGALLPCRIETMTPALLAGTARAAEELDVVVRLHCMQGLQELKFLDAWYGRTPVELLTEAGLLTSRLLIPHCIMIGGVRATEESRAADLRRLAAAGVHLVHCPLTSGRYGTALRTIDDYLAAGMNIAIGSDSFPPDLIKAMDYGNNVAKLLGGRLSAGNAADYYRAATLGSAQALGRNDIGRLAVGALADIIVVDLSDHRIGAIDDPIRTMLTNADGTAVRTSVVNGRTVMADRQLPGVDLAELHEQVQDYFGRMKAGYPERDYLGRGLDELFPPTFREAGSL